MSNIYNPGRPKRLPLRTRLEIKRRYDLHAANTPRKLAKEFGVCERYIYDIAGRCRCPNHPRTNQLPKSPSTSTPAT